MTISAPKIEEITDFLDTLDFPVENSEFETLGDPINLLPPNFQEQLDQTVAVGSQIAGFGKEVPKKIRPIISNVFLLAQLVADKKTAGEITDSDLWYKTYLATLSQVGWQVSGRSNAEQVISGTALEVYKEIIPIITAALGPAVAAASTIVAVLKGLNNIDKDQPWITLFNRKSQRVSANQFQISHTRMEGGIPVIVLIAFKLDASHLVTQVLFFKFANSDAKLIHFEQKLSTDLAVLNHSELQIQNLVLDHISGNIAALGDLEL